MAKQTILLGTLPNDGTGDPIRTAFTKINANFTELYDGGGVAADLGNFKISGNALGTKALEGDGWGGYSMYLSPNGEGAAYIGIPNDDSATEGGYLTIANYPTDSGGVRIEANTNYWTFKPDGSLLFPTLTVPISDNANPVGIGQTLKFSDTTKQAIIYGPTSTELSPSAERIIIQGAAGYTGTDGEGGDVYVWAGPGGSVNGNGGDIKVRAGQGNGTGGGGYLNFQAGDSSTGNGGYVNIEGGQSNTYGNGGDITIRAHDGGEIFLQTHNDITTQQWQFNNDGALTLPTGGTITEGIVTSNPTIQLTPANPDVPSQKLVIKGGGNYSADENGIYLNWYIINPQVGDTVEISVFSEANANQTLYWWIYPTGANISDPGAGTVTLGEGGAVVSGPISFVVDSDDYEFTVRVSPTNNVYDSASIGVETLVFNSSAPSFGEHHLHLTTGDLTETSIFLGTDDHNVRTTVNGGIEITTPNESNNVWQFGSNGDLELPSGGGIVFDRANTTIRVGMGFHIASGEGVSIEAIDETDPDNLVYKNWYFSPDGSLTLPGAVVKSTVSKTGANPDGNRVYFEVTQVDEAGTVTEVTVINSPNPAWITPTSGISYVDIDYTVNFDVSGNATVTVNSSGTGHSLGEAWDIAAEAVGATAPTPTAIDLTKSINKLANGICTLADGVEGQIMYLVPQNGATVSGIEVSIENARLLSNIVTPASISNNVAYYPFAGADNAWHNNIATLIFTDGAWNVSTGSFD